MATPATATTSETPFTSTWAETLDKLRPKKDEPAKADAAVPGVK